MKRRRPWHGLGLAIVKHAMHALGGEVKIDSTPGVGTTITCTLPAAGSAPSQPTDGQRAKARSSV